MNLSLLNPLFLIGLAALALPIIAHLISRKSGVRKSFPAVNFLISSQGDLATRSRLKDLILLLLRALILVFIVLIFAKPAVFSFSAKIDDSPKSIAIVIDNSFSMGYENNFENAKKIARELIDSIPDGSFTLIAPLVQTNEDEISIQEQSSLKKAVQKIDLSYSFANNNKRLGDIYTKLQKTPNENKKVVFITDFQKNGWEDDEINSPWLEIVDISQSKENSNHAVTEAALSYDDSSITVTSKVSNFSNNPISELLTITTLGNDEIRESTDISPHDSSSIKVNFRNLVQTKGSGTVNTTQDKLIVDDIRYFVKDGRENSPKILVVDGDPREDSRLSETYYLTQALETISEISGTQIKILDNDAFLTEEISSYGIVYLANVGDITPRAAKELEVFVEKGGTVVIFLGNSIRANSYNTLLKNFLPVELISIDESGKSLVAEDSKTFSKEVRDKIAQINIEKLFNTTQLAESEAIISTNDGMPFLATKQYGSGNTYVFTSTADTSWNNFSITPVFLPIIKKIYDLPNIEKNIGRHYLVNDIVKVDSSTKDMRTVVVDPSGDKHSFEAGKDSFNGTRLPGIYTVEIAGELSFRFAVNIDPRESNLEELPKISKEAEEDQNGGLVKVFKEIWRYFLWGVIALFVSESLVRSIFR